MDNCEMTFEAAENRIRTAMRSLSARVKSELMEAIRTREDFTIIPTGTTSTGQKAVHVSDKEFRDMFPQSVDRFVSVRNE
jgi:hypothetical protein